MNNTTADTFWLNSVDMQAYVEEREREREMVSVFT